MELKLGGFNELQSSEIEEINGGGPIIVAAIIVGGICVVAFGVGVYNGYKDNKK